MEFEEEHEVTEARLRLGGSYTDIFVHWRTARQSSQTHYSHVGAVACAVLPVQEQKHLGHTWPKYHMPVRMK